MTHAPFHQRASGRPFAALALVAALGVATLSAAPGLAAETIEDRIEQGLNAAGEAAPTGDIGIMVMPDDLGDEDVSLAPGTDSARLRTTLEPIDIERRIDKGLTAAGEASAFPPDYAFGAFQRGWFLTAFSLALERAESGDPVAQTLLGVLLSRGLGVKQDLTAAADWYRLAGEGGDREALYALGQLYLDGSGVTRDLAAAAALFRRAADLDHAGAARELGYLLLAGEAVDQNAMLAAAFFSRAARLGDMDAQYTLAGLFVEGIGVVGDESHAARWYAEAARNGHVGAQVEYAIMLVNGRGVPQDEAAAAYWFRLAANSNNPLAQTRLARMLAEGVGVARDAAAAARWYFIARSHGVEDERLEAWLERLDPAIRESAEAEARQWVAARGGAMQLASAPDGQGAPADSAVE